MIKNPRAVLALLTGLNLLNYIDRYIVAAVMKPMQASVGDGGLGLSNFEGGMLGTAFMLGYFATSPLFGARADKSKRTGLIALGVAIWSIATIATGLAHTFWQMIAARVVVGVGEASYATLAPTIIDDMTPPDRKGKALAIFYMAIPVGSALGYVVGGFIEKHWGWRSAFYFAGGPGMALALACLLVAEPERQLREAKGKILDGLKTIAKLPLFRRAVLGYCAYTAALGAFAYWAPKYLAETYASSLTNDQASTYFGTVTVLGGLIGTVVGGQWSDRALHRIPGATGGLAWNAGPTKLGTNALLYVCALSTAIAVPLVAVCFAMPTSTTFFAVAFAAEVGLFLSTSPVSAIGLRAVPPELRASAMAGMIFAIHLFGDLWSPAVLGLLYDHLEPAVAMMVIPVVLAWAAYIWWPRRREAAPDVEIAPA